MTTCIAAVHCGERPGRSSTCLSDAADLHRMLSLLASQQCVWLDATDLGLISLTKLPWLWSGPKFRVTYQLGTATLSVCILAKQKGSIFSISRRPIYCHISYQGPSHFDILSIYFASRATTLEEEKYATRPSDLFPPLAVEVFGCPHPQFDGLLQ